MAVTYTAQEAVLEALRIAQMPANKGIGWKSQVNLLNASYSFVYNRIARSSDRPFIYTLEVNGKEVCIPRDLQKIDEIRWANSRSVLQPSQSPTGVIGSNYCITNNIIKLPSEGPWEIDYIPTPDTLLFNIEPIELNTLTGNDKPVIMDDEYLIYSNDEGFWSYNFDTESVTELDNEYQPRNYYMEWTDIEITDGLLFGTDAEGNREDLSLYFQNPFKTIKSYCSARPYFYVSYTDGTVDGYENMKHFTYNPFFNTANRHRIEVLCGWTNDRTGWGLIVKESALIKDRYWLMGFTEDTLIEYPVNIYWPFLICDLAIRFAQANSDINENLMTLYQAEQTNFEVQVARSRPSASVRRAYNYR